MKNRIPAYSGRENGCPKNRLRPRRAKSILAEISDDRRSLRPVRFHTGMGGLGFSEAELKFTPEVYSKILRDKRIDHGAFRLWHTLRDMGASKEDGKSWPGTRYLCKCLGCSASTLNRWTKQLVKKKYLKCKRNRTASTSYFVTVTPVRPDVTVVGSDDTPVRSKKITSVTKPIPSEPNELTKEKEHAYVEISGADRERLWREERKMT